MASNVGASISKRMGKLEREVRGAQRAAVNRASLELKKATEAEIKRIAPSMRMSGVGRKRGGARVGVRYDIKGKDNPTSIVKAYGPLHLLERDTKAHPIFVRAETARGRGSARINLERRLGQAFGGVGAYRFGVLKLAEGVFRRIVQHPGTSGQKPYEKGIERGTPKALKELHGSMSNAVKRGFQ